MSMELLLEKVTSDPAFADQVRSDPEEALRSVGVDPTADLVASIKEAADNEDLAARISKKSLGTNPFRK